MPENDTVQNEKSVSKSRYTFFLPRKLMNKFGIKIFKKKEVLSVDHFYEFIERKKIVVFVPLKFLEILTHAMSVAGAGSIGNYEMCSFRTEGIGTYKPNEKAKPFAGKKNALYYSDEIKLEMECDAEDINKVTDAMLKHHPYEEIAYEIYDFRKRAVKTSGEIIELRSEMPYSELLKRLNKKILSMELTLDDKFRKILLTSSEINDRILRSARFIEAECLLLFSKNNYKLYKI